MSSLNVTTDSIKRAMREYDKLGAAEFHARYGTSASVKYTIRHNGREYPSKAIVAAAARVSPKSFSGGKARLGKLLARAGFTLGILAVSAAAPGVVEGAAGNFAGSGNGQVDAVYFASGSNRPGEIRGFKAVGQALGVAAPEVTGPAEDELMALAGTGIPVFVDSGAFSEVKFGPKGPKVVKPITEGAWQDVLDLYNRLGAVLGSQLYVVAPDQVGFQGETLERLARWKEEVRALISMGVNVICVAQKGEMSQADFDRQVEATLGTGEYIRGLPCNKNATSVTQARAFAADRKPGRIHFLGLGLRSARAPKMAQAIAAVSPETTVSYDSCLIVESSGKANGRASHPKERRGGPRVLTWAKQQVTAIRDAGRAVYRCAQELAIILAFGGSGQQLSLLA